jgi:hypothetical protein
VTRQTGYFKVDPNQNINGDVYGTLFRASQVFANDSTFNGLFTDAVGNWRAARSPVTEPANVTISVFCLYDNQVYFEAEGCTTLDQVKAYLASHPLYIQYKLSASYTETYDPNFTFARIQPYALEYAKSEADRSSNLCDNATFLDGVTSFHCCSANYSNGQLNLVSAGEDSYIGEGFISPYNPKYGKRINVKPDTTYTLSTGSSDINKNFITLYDSNGTKVSSIWSNGTNIATFTTPSTCAFITIRVGYGSSVAGTTYPFNIMLNEGSHPLPYQPYEGEAVHENEMLNKYDLSSIKASITSSGCP